MSNNKLTWPDLVDIEPELADVMESARMYDGRCANSAYYGYRTHDGGLRSRLIALVGNFARSDNPTIRTSEAYDVAVDAIYDALPPCDHEGILCYPGVDDDEV